MAVERGCETETRTQKASCTYVTCCMFFRSALPDGNSLSKIPSPAIGEVGQDGEIRMCSPRMSFAQFWQN
jgi:hypothetical protein